MNDLGRLRVWKDSTIRGALSWYLAVAENRRPAKFRIAATLATDIDPATSSEDALCAELNRLTPIFVERWQAIRAGAPLPEAAEGAEPARALPGACLPHARPLQLLPMGRRSCCRHEVRCVQARLSLTRQLSLPSYWRGA